MAQEHSAPQMKTPWTKIFTAFKVALDMKKLVLAAAGILCAYLGWFALSWAFYFMRSEAPRFDYEEKEDAAALKAKWDQFKARRASWNLLHELAGTYDPDKPVKVDAGDIAADAEEYKIFKSWQEGYQRLSDLIEIKDDKLKFPGLNKTEFTFTTAQGGGLEKLQNATLTVRSVSEPKFESDPKTADKESLTLKIDDVKVQVKGANLEALNAYLDGVFNAKRLEQKASTPQQKKSLQTFTTQLIEPRPKVAGLLRVCPWSENRGENPYLIVAKAIETRGDSVFGGGRFFTWFFTDEAPVVMEPLFKFLLPIVYLFDSRAGGWDRLYLILMMLWTLVTWGFFGGAICRIAAVQVARNERITLREAILFTKDRCASYIAAPVFPMVLVLILTFVLMIFGWVQWIPWFVGDTIGGLLYPIVILLGFVMAIVLVGLVGWPLMIATVSTEGTDSFDALSRSYSYVYQAPWQYLWSSFLAVAYGAVLVFFIGFMASLVVFLGKWGVSSAIGPATGDPKTDREPSYLFYYAPTSFGWRDLLISSNARFVQEKTFVEYDGRTAKRLEFKEDYQKEMRSWEKTGSVLVSLWIYPLFLLVVGFGYSYFWSSSTIIYFLMRKHVDDTEMDEVHIEDEAMEDPFLKPAPTPAAAPVAAPSATKPGTVSLNVVEAPPAPSYTTAEHSHGPAGASETTKPPPEVPPGR